MKVLVNPSERNRQAFGTRIMIMAMRIRRFSSGYTAEQWINIILMCECKGTLCSGSVITYHAGKQRRTNY
jgi:hypothetical protein